MAKERQTSGSFLLLNEYFGSEDACFLDELRACSDAPKLAGLADRWKKDPRPWAREMIFAYLALPLNCQGHQPIVKRLFKHALAQRDHKLVAAFAFAFDRLVRRVKRTRFQWDSDARQGIQIEHLSSPRNVLKSPARTANGQWKNPSGRRRAGMLFSQHTRAYLRRRSWRYLRLLGHQHPIDYPAAAAETLRLFGDDDLKAGENILDSWTLLHICFGEHDALEFGSAHAALKDGRALSELTAKPAFPEIWAQPESFPILLGLVHHAGSRMVRVWAIQNLRALHKAHFSTMAIEDILKLLEHEDEEVQQFGAEVFGGYEGLDKLPMAVWSKLLETRNLTALQTICDAFLKHVRGDRLSLSQCVELASVQPSPVAKLGLNCLKERKISSMEERRAISALAGMKCPAVAAEMTEWALPILGEKSAYERDAVIGFFDCLQKEARSAAWNWLLKKEGPAYDDAGLWARLLETPYEDMRLPIVDLLAVRALPGTNADALESLWSSVLLAVHRGGRQKSKAVRQIGEAIRENPSRAENLIPVLAVAIRSVRPAEARAGLASLVAAAERSPQLSASIQKHIPELNLSFAEALK